MISRNNSPHEGQTFLVLKYWVNQGITPLHGVQTMAFDMVATDSDGITPRTGTNYNR